MSTSPSRTSAGRRADAGLLAAALRTERTVALMRICVFGVVMSVYLGSLGNRRAPASAAIVLLALAGIYAFACLVISTTDEGSHVGVRAATVLIDVALVTLWVQVTGGALSEFWTLYLVVVVAVALRFGPIQTIALAIALAIVHGAMLFGSEGLATTQLYRPTLLIVAGFASGVLSFQRADQTRRRREVEAIAATRAEQLGRERAEVARLRQVDLARSEFLGVAAHELRTPLAAILGVLSTLREHGPALEERMRVELAEGAEAQAERLSRLVEDLLTISRIEDGVLRLSFRSVDARALVAEAARASGTEDRAELVAPEAETVVCDADAVIRVLTNLLDNARKYAPPGSAILVEVSSDEERAWFTVSDEGPGIAVGDREAVFERFRRADGTGQPGAGLGLYISSGLVRAHGGELRLGGSASGGAAFSFWLPRRVPGERAVPVGGLPPVEAGAALAHEPEPAPGRAADADGDLEPSGVDVNRVTVPPVPTG